MISTRAASPSAAAHGNVLAGIAGARVMEMLRTRPRLTEHVSEHVSEHVLLSYVRQNQNQAQRRDVD
jgi:hypothetical protein